jgi:hypothetical protein
MLHFDKRDALYAKSPAPTLMRQLRPELFAIPKLDMSGNRELPQNPTEPSVVSQFGFDTPK